MNPLIDAAQDGDLIRVQNLISEQTQTSESVNKAFLVAVGRCHISLATFLLESAGANVQCFDNMALRTASIRGHVSIVKFLLRAGANGMDVRALENAAEYGHLTIVKILLEAGANPRQCAIERPTKKGHTAVVQCLLHANANVDSTIFNIAVARGHYDLIRCFLATKNVHCTSESLSLAAGNGHKSIVQLILNEGVDVNSNDNYALRFAASRGDFEMCSFLLDNGASFDPNWENLNEDIRHQCLNYSLGPKSALKLK